MKKVNYLIIGNGIAGLSAAKAIRRKDPEGRITIISTEEKHTYFRIKLTEYISEDYTMDKTYVNQPQWYEDNNVEVLLETKAVKLDEEKLEVTLDSGEVIDADKLLLAMGASAFVPPIKNIDKKGIFALRTIEDLEEFKDYISDKENITVIGGGLLGLEAAHALLKLGKNVNVVESFKYVLGRQLDEELGMNLNKELEDLGMNIYVGKNTAEFTGEETVADTVLEDGTKIKSDAVLVSTGVRPNLDLVKETSIEYEKGILVNEQLETNIKNIFAAGDGVEIFGMTTGLWTASMEMGKIAGNNMCGENQSYEMPKLFTNLSIGDINIFSCGEVSNYDEVYKYDDDINHHRIYIKDNKTIGGVLDGDTKEKNAIKKFVFNHEPVDSLNTCPIPFEK